MNSRKRLLADLALAVSEAVEYSPEVEMIADGIIPAVVLDITVQDIIDAVSGTSLKTKAPKGLEELFEAIDESIGGSLQVAVAVEAIKASKFSQELPKVKLKIDCPLPYDPFFVDRMDEDFFWTESLVPH